MAIKKYKPTSPGRRFRTLVTTDHLSKKRPEKSLTRPLKQNAGRGRGTISVRGRGGGHKRLYRVIDFQRRDKMDIPATVIALEYDPNRSAHIALLEYDDGEKRYILAPKDLHVDDQVISGDEVRIRVGNALPLANIPIGTEVHNIELKPGQGGQIARTAGNSARVAAKEAGWVHVRMPSGEIRLVNERCFATVGEVGNAEHARRKLGKAGVARYLGRRPKVRGVAMAAGDHPHGGGEGRTGPGRIPRTKEGRIAHGKRTRKKNKSSNRYVVKSRRTK